MISIHQSHNWRWGWVCGFEGPKTKTNGLFTYGKLKDINNRSFNEVKFPMSN